ncbi:MAG: hypothetical protein MO853_09555 [Candidatus Protistobacter heckmanni]|nr:hypothetical protein [Candidatus Protistobacter heckmanni]
MRLSDAVTIELQRLADNGNSVPLTFGVQTSPGRRLVTLEVIALLNPRPLVAQLRPGMAFGALSFQTRMRLAASQTVWTVATLDNGERIGTMT